VCVGFDLGKIPRVKIWVAGAGGSLGKSLISTLESKGINPILAPTRADLDLEDQDAVFEYVMKNKPTHVFHLAAKVFGISGHQQHPEESLIINTRIDNNIFSSLFESPPEWVYYSSTVAAYGYPYLHLPLNEEDFLQGTPHASEFGYATSKRFALNYLQMLHEIKKTKYVYGLTTNLFGSGDRFLEGRGHVVISLLEKAKQAKRERKQLEVWGSGSASRDFLSTFDAAALIVSLMDKQVGVVNIASGQEIPISEIAEYIVEAFDIEEGFKFIGINEGITSRVCSTRKLSMVTDLISKIDSRKVLRAEIINFAKNND